MYEILLCKVRVFVRADKGNTEGGGGVLIFLIYLQYRRDVILWRLYKCVMVHRVETPYYDVSTTTNRTNNQTKTNKYDRR